LNPRNRLKVDVREILREEFLIPLGMSLPELARRAGTSETHLQAFFDGTPLDGKLASGFAEAFGTSREFWLNLAGIPQ
jgi:plasmid maintenance system antidote protein VapI